MLGILVGLLISWGLLYFIEKESLLALGFLPMLKRGKQFLLGFLISGLLSAFFQYIESLLEESSWILNEQISASLMLEAFYWDFKSVLTEEFIFRGALLYILMKRIGTKKAILVSAITFGVYHWFSYGIFGNIMPMIWIFVGTGLMGYIWAFAFAKTESIMLPLGFHLGWNFVQNTLFSKGPLGELVWIAQGGQELEGWTSLFNFLLPMLCVPLLLWIFMTYFMKAEPKELSIK